MGRTRVGKRAALAVGALVLVSACTSSDPGTSEGATTTAATATGPAPGVTDDAIKIGVTYVDTAALVASGLNYDLGDFKGTYNALFDAINADGGINGRRIEPVFAPIDPTKPSPAEEACVKLTEDDDVFAITGFFLNDAVVCPLSTHATAVVGGAMTPERIAQAKAPWATTLADTDQPETTTRAFADLGELDGKVAVYANARDKEALDEHVLPVLDDLGIEPVETGIVDAPSDDPAAVQQNVQLVGQKFEDADADTVLIVGASGQDWPTYMNSNTSYRPKLLFLDEQAPRAFFTNAATTDTSILDGSLSGGGYGPDQARFEEQGMQDCVATIADAGIDTPSPEDAGDDPSVQPYQAAFLACPDVALLKALLDAAGKDLNYGTLEGAIDGLKVSIPGDPTARTYGPPPDADGNPTAYVFSWDSDKKNYVLAED